jgi:hypothetical protein
MTHLKEFLEAIQYKITEGSDHNWLSFGPDAHQLDSWNGDHNGYTACCIFDKKNQQVYSLELWDYERDRYYRWVQPEYLDAYKKDHKQHGAPFEMAGEHVFTDLDVVDDILEKIAKCVNGEEYDTRVQVPIDIPDEDLLVYFKAAHERDMTFNQFVEEALRSAMESYERDPEGFRQRMESFKDEKGVL